MSSAELVHVAVGVILNNSGEVLISRRHPDSHQGGFWEFPGGKLEAGESVESALQRELAEELGLELQRFFPIKKIRHDYSDKSVLLDVWVITEFTGKARGLEGQAIKWCPLSQLSADEFPAANAPIITTLQLPYEIAITPDLSTYNQLEHLLGRQIASGVSLIQLRQKQLGESDYLAWFQRASEYCSAEGVRLMFNNPLQLFPAESGAGFHANSAQLQQLQQRPVSADQLFSAACHNLEQLKLAERLGADFVYLSPVCYTNKYAKGNELGWKQFQQLAGQISLPVYALGGVSRADFQLARRHGAMGIAGISSFL